MSDTRENGRERREGPGPGQFKEYMKRWSYTSVDEVQRGTEIFVSDQLSQAGSKKEGVAQELMETAKIKAEDVEANEVSFGDVTVDVRHVTVFDPDSGTPILVPVLSERPNTQGFDGLEKVMGQMAKEQGVDEENTNWDEVAENFEDSYENGEAFQRAVNKMNVKFLGSAAAVMQMKEAVKGRSVADSKPIKTVRVGNDTFKVVTRRHNGKDFVSIGV